MIVHFMLNMEMIFKKLGITIPPPYSPIPHQLKPQKVKTQLPANYVWQQVLLSYVAAII